MTQEDLHEKVQTKSITSRVTVYHIPSEHIVKHFGNVNMTGNASRTCINLIDVPGFADVAGEMQDQKIFQMIATILGELESLDYVFLVVKSDTQRVNYAVKNIYDKIQNLYAKDLVPRLCGIFTFAADKTPPAVNALK